MSDIDNTPWCTCGECDCGDKVRAENERLRKALDAIADEGGLGGILARDALRTEDGNV